MILKIREILQYNSLHFANFPFISFELFSKNYCDYFFV